MFARLASVAVELANLLSSGWAAAQRTIGASSNEPTTSQARTLPVPPPAVNEPPRTRGEPSPRPTS